LKISNGRFIRKERSDSLYGKIYIPMFGILDFESGIINDSLSGDIIDSTKIVGTITGVKARPDSKIDYGNLMNDIVDTTRKYIFDPQMLQTRKWKKFKKKMSLVFDKATDDIEIFFGFNILNRKLPFSHYNLFLFPQEPDLKTDNKTHNVYLEEKGTNTVYLNIKSFGGTAGEMDSIFNLVFSKHYENMIVDLRNNSGGGINSAIPFGQYLTTKPLDAGVFLTNKWFREHSDKPDRETYLKIPVSRAKTTEGFIDELKNNNARRLVIQPGNKSFRGNIYVLTSHKTASTCEPIVYALKKYGIATIVGEKTAGAMLSATTVQVKGKYYIFLPIADFYTFDGIRIDQHGVEPDIKVKSQKALDYVLENLIK
ncbi:MAG TPA: hypothetical protein ENH02_00400, partial [Bacteroidetes bacterium]|nr:hypothetical protein [Bacteroidota bacterium]